MTLEDEKRLSLLAAILHLDGHAPKGRVLDTIEALALVKLDERDRELLHSRSEERWRNDLAFIRSHLVKDGYLSGNRYDDWAITDSGRRYAGELASRAGPQNAGSFVHIQQAVAIILERLAPPMDDGAAESAETVALEGEKRLLWSTKYERDPALRAAAIRHHGLQCMACGFSFAQGYGSAGEGFIEVHHVYPIGQASGPTLVDARTDLIVLCSNCHSVVHRRKNRPLSLPELRACLRPPAKH